jgi:hypothetical protein
MARLPMRDQESHHMEVRREEWIFPSPDRARDACRDGGYAWRWDPVGLTMKKFNFDFDYVKFRLLVSLTALASLAMVLSAGRRWI